MDHLLRKAFPYLALLLGISALAYALSFAALPPADFVFNNGDDIRTVDPAVATGVPEHRIISGLFEGLLSDLPAGEPNAAGITPYKPQPGVAERFTVSSDGRVYTFHLRGNAVWTDGSPVTAHDFVWSWRRTLHPETASQYAYQLYYIAGAKDYNESDPQVNMAVEVELKDRPNPLQLFPRGTVLKGKLTAVHKSPEPVAKEDDSEEVKQRATADWKRSWVYVVLVDGQERRFSKSALADAEPCLHVLTDFEATVGVNAPDDRTLEVTLNSPTPYFPHLAAFYTLFPVHRGCVEKYGVPNWTKPANIVTNGPFRLNMRRIRDRIRLEKNDQYWNAATVQVQTIDALAVKSDVTALNMYENGQLDWSYPIPPSVLEDIKPRADFRTAPSLATYFYRINCRHSKLDNPKVRRALNLAIDKQEICERVTRAGQLPAGSLCPPGMPGYEGPAGETYDPERARALLAEAGFPGGAGFPEFSILYNTSETHGDIAQVIQRQWQEHLGIKVRLKNMEWAAYLDAQDKADYEICRAGWTGDYPDPNTFLDMWLAGGTHNMTGWSNAEYDRLIQQAALESDPTARMRLMRQAEEILVSEMPILPIYFYVSSHLVRTYVDGFYSNVLDIHPLQTIRVNAEAKQTFLRSLGGRR